VYGAYSEETHTFYVWHAHSPDLPAMVAALVSLGLLRSHEQERADAVVVPLNRKRRRGPK